MKQFFTTLLVLCLALPVMAQDGFVRMATIEADTLDIGGFGNIVAGVDFDDDGLAEIYAVNSDWHDQLGYDLTPRIYKYEVDANGDWSAVWWAVLDFDFQNTWPALAAADLDNDGKWEIVWGPVNNFGGGLNNNPARIVVFETVGDGSDNMGVADGDDWLPNAQWTITEMESENLRPFRWRIADIDDDGTDEIVASARVGNGIQIYSTDDIPDNGDGSETWSLEFSGLTGTFYDLAIIGSTVYGIQDNGDVTSVTYVASGDSFRVGQTQVGLAGGGAWNSSAVVDVDGDGTDEIILAGWSSSANDVYLLQQSGDTLTATVIADVPATSNRSYGGAAGDVDGDGNVDFAFGTRESTPNAIIYNVEYQGGAIDDPNNWVLTIADQEISAAVQYDIFAMGDVDGDGDDELIYTGTPRGLSATDAPQPIVILNSVPSTSVDGTPALPSAFSLSNNYPNPFNPETQISYNLPSDSQVSLKIYNMMGQEIRTLASEMKAAGTYTVRWDGQSNDGVKVASGVYVYVLRAGDFMQSKRMTLLK